MTQPAQAVGGEATPVTDPRDTFTQLAAEEFGISDEPEEEPAPVEGEPLEDSAEGTDDEPQIEEEADDLPPIDAPVSWDAEAKEVFKSLPRDAQEIVQKREAERERFVQQKSQEATQAKQTAAQEAQQQLAAYDAQVAQHIQSLAEQLQPQRPNPQLLQVDPQAFYAQQAQYEATVAQQQQLQQQAFGFAQQAQARAAQMEQAHNAEQHRIIVENFPEYADPTTGPELRSKLSALAKELGYTDELIGQARASDILAMRKAADWKAKADKYDALQANKMAKVRAAKGLPKVATPGVAQGADAVRARTAQVALETVKSSRNRDVQGDAFYKFLQNTGQI